MPKNIFFDEQNDATAVKIKFYQKYIESYLFKVLMQFGTCIIADLFCGSGKNGKENGSPLVLIEIAKKVLESEVLIKKHKNLKIIILFNDIDKENIENLNAELLKIEIPKTIEVLPLENQEFFTILDEINKSELFKKIIPKFFFLDPFEYTKFSSVDIKILMDLPMSEVLFFLPVFFAYRFSNAKIIPPKLDKFLNDFTTRGKDDYEDVYDFNDSIKEKLKISLNLDFVRPLLIDMGSTKNSLFFLTKHILGMLLMNKLFFKNSDDGLGVSVKELKKRETKPTLFDKKQIETKDFKSNIANFQIKLEEELKIKRKITNKEIIKFTITEGFLPSHANDLLKELKKENKIEVDYLSKESTKGYYASENKWNEELAFIKYIK